MAKLSANRFYGIKSIEFAPIAGDGGMGTAFTEIGDTVISSAAITTEEGTRTDIFVEETDTPIESFLAQAAAMTFNLSTHNLNADAMVFLFGGTKTTGPPVKWNMPDDIPARELSIKITDKKLNIVEIVRASVQPRLNMNLNKTALAQADLTATILQPTKANTPKMTFTYA